MTAWQNDRITEWQNHRMTESQNDRNTEWQKHRMTETQNDSIYAKAAAIPSKSSSQISGWSFTLMHWKWESTEMTSSRISQQTKWVGNESTDTQFRYSDNFLFEELDAVDTIGVSRLGCANIVRALSTTFSTTFATTFGRLLDGLLTHTGRGRRCRSFQSLFFGDGFGFGSADFSGDSLVFFRRYLGFAFALWWWLRLCYRLAIIIWQFVNGIQCHGCFDRNSLGKSLSCNQNKHQWFSLRRHLWLKTRGEISKTLSVNPRYWFADAGFLTRSLVLSLPTCGNPGFVCAPRSRSMGCLNPVWKL